jgi:hypothetical protein
MTPSRISALEEVAKQARIAYRESSSEGFLQTLQGADELDKLSELLNTLDKTPPAPSEEAVKLIDEAIRYAIEHHFDATYVDHDITDDTEIAEDLIKEFIALKALNSQVGKPEPPKFITLYKTISEDFVTASDYQVLSAYCDQQARELSDFTRRHQEIVEQDCSSMEYYKDTIENLKRAISECESDGGCRASRISQATKV